MWTNAPEAEFQVTISKKKIKISSFMLVYVLYKKQNEAFSRGSRSKAEKKCTEKCDARRKLLLCLLNLLIFFTFSLPSASFDLKVPTIKCLTTEAVSLISSHVLSSLLQIVVFLSNKLFLFLANFVTLKIYKPTVPYYQQKVIPYRRIDRKLTFSIPPNVKRLSQR